MNDNIYIYGVNSVTEYLKTKPELIKQIYVQEGFDARTLEQWRRNYQVAISVVGKHKLVQLTKTDKHQGVAALIHTPEPVELKVLINSLKNKSTSVVWMLDQIEDPHNLGAILRSAAQFGIDGVVFMNRRQVGITPTVVKASAGACFHVPICIVNNLANAINDFKQNNFWIYATSLTEQAQDVRRVEFNTPSVVIVGNEGAGVSQKLVRAADYNIYVPMLSKIDSLNVSVASAILMFQIRSNQKVI